MMRASMAQYFQLFRFRPTCSDPVAARIARAGTQAVGRMSTARPRGRAVPLALLGAATLLARPRMLWGPAPVCMATVVAAASGSAASGVMILNGQAVEPKMPKAQLLKEHKGAYTTARTVDHGTAIFELSMHCQRLYDTAVAVLDGELDTGSSNTRTQAREFLRKSGAEGLKPLVCREIKAAMLQIGGSAAETADYQVTMLLTWDGVGSHTPSDRGFDVITFVQAMPTIAPMVATEAHRADRDNPTIKSLQWVTDRERLEEVQKAAGVNEILMFDSKGYVTEGLQTNFFAVSKEGTLITAPDNRVLAGTVRKVALQVAAKNGIPISFECPNIGDVDTWESCFICSTSRLVKPISEVNVPEKKTHKTFPVAGSIAHRVETLVKDAIRENSERL